VLLTINTQSLSVEKKPGRRLSEFRLDERKLQDVLFRSLDRLFADDELILLMQSKRGREEPDLMAIDKEGYLYIFELKAWESTSENLLQVLRYGQLYGTSQYRELDSMYREHAGSGQSLADAHKEKFEVELRKEDFNGKQIFVVVTNGLDHKTRAAIQYWRSCKLDIRPWVYRVYEGRSEHECFLEVSAFRKDDNPFEDLDEGYFILNTNVSNDIIDHEDMLNNRKAAAYFSPWKEKIAQLERGDVVFLYQSGVGIVALGEADGKLCKADYHGKTEHREDEFYRKLNKFQFVDPPLSAAEIKRISGTNYVFMSTMFGVDAESGKKIRQYISERGTKK
jgi:hypothetical protein